ncbi:ABC-2 transporter permease [Papillibacter cinnamivorans]|uniref:ABC-2 family transporter protein n=1 Tax=Papillibacter cinnamivorans DSM 12816 TaxID=1122930 RepID=A0A1W2CAG9_9FIRM|nr:ABC-2 transporter permease [Papillibacter cinnamivorans]SMC81872.1 ABC-2 family transporter protein [Papillibacter cinnamivorans DSM 12816]
MTGLILKDLLNLKRQGKIIAILFAFYLFLSLTSHDSSFFGGVVAVLCAMLPVTALSYDERCKWDKYALTMPVSRKDLVISKYLLGALFCAAGFLVNFAFNLITGSGNIAEALEISLSLLSVGMFFISLILPILFQFGVEKGRLLMMLVLFVPVAVVVFLSTQGLSLPKGKNLD